MVISDYKHVPFLNQLLLYEPNLVLSFRTYHFLPLTETELPPRCINLSEVTENFSLPNVHYSVFFVNRSPVLSGPAMCSTKDCISNHPLYLEIASEWILAVIIGWTSLKLLSSDSSGKHV